jgi:hypothetical protein
MTDRGPNTPRPPIEDPPLSPDADPQTPQPRPPIEDPPLHSPDPNEPTLPEPPPLEPTPEAPDTIPDGPDPSPID